MVNTSLLANIESMNETEWQRYVENIQGTLVTYPGKVGKIIFKIEIKILFF